MQIFSKRNKVSRESSGYREASVPLRNRLLNLYGHPYSGNEFGFGAGNTNWIHEHALSKDLQMQFGKKIPLEDFRDPDLTTYDQVFDFIEVYYSRAQADLDSTKRLRLLRNLILAFNLSGSVYEFDPDGEVVLRIDESTAEDLKEVDSALEPFSKAQEIYREAVTGLITRSKKPADAIKDICIAFEEYCKNKAQKTSFEDAFKKLVQDASLHPLQKKVISNLIDYRGDVWGVAHAGNNSEPTEEDALWYIKTFVAQIKSVDDKLLGEINGET